MAIAVMRRRCCERLGCVSSPPRSQSDGRCFLAPFTTLAGGSRARGELRHLVEPPAMRRPPREVRSEERRGGSERGRQGGAWSRELRTFSRRSAVVDFFLRFSPIRILGGGWRSR